MAFALIRKHFAWLIIAAVLVGEGVLMVVAAGRNTEAESRIKVLEGKRVRLDQLKVQVEGDPQRHVLSVKERIGIYEARKAAARRELGDCLVFFWRLREPYSRLFDAKELANYDVAPWRPAPQMDVFRADYQAVYNREVDKLEPTMAKVGASRAGLGLADRAAFMQADVTINDIFEEQKGFWIRKELVEVLHRVEARLERLDFLGGAEFEREDRHGGAALVVRFHEPLPLRIVARCEFPRIDALIEELLRSSLCLRIYSIESVKRTPTEKMVAAAGGGPVPVKAEKDVAVQLVTMSIVGEIPSFNLDLQQVTFARPQFRDKASVLSWIDNETKRLAHLHRGCAAAAARPERTGGWIGTELADVAKALADAPAGKAVPIDFEDRLSAPTRWYSFADAAGAREWLDNRYRFELVHIEGLQELWNRVRSATEKGRLDERNQAGVAVLFRPLDQFDAAQVFPQPLDPEGHVVATLGYATFKAAGLPARIKRASIEAK